MAMVDTNGCQRWHEGKARFRPVQETIDTGRHAVAPIDEAIAKRFVEQHHYARSYPAARARYGLFRKERGRTETLVGAAVFSVPMNQRAIPRHTGFNPDQGVELGRFVLTDDVEAMGETWFLARCARLLTEDLHDVRAVLSYSDPVPRRSVSGDLVKPGHIGLIYQGFNARYRGRGSARTLIMASDGTVVSERTITKLRTDDRGARYAYETLRRLGAPVMKPGEDSAAYVQRALMEGGFRRMRHPGNHVYVFPVGDRRERRDAKMYYLPEGITYPRMVEAMTA